MLVSLDTNVWIFGMVGVDPFCETILFNLDRFKIIVPDQIRAELERNLSDADMRQFYRFTFRYDMRLDFAPVPQNLIAMFEKKGLKKGDAEIGAFCEWRQVDVVVSDNRHFLRDLAPGHSFRVMSPQEFCQVFDL